MKKHNQAEIYFNEGFYWLNSYNLKDKEINVDFLLLY